MIVLALVPLLIAFAGCRTVEPYSIGARSQCERTITDVDIVYGKFHAGGGTLSPGSAKCYLYPPVPIPQSAVVHWRSDDGVVHIVPVAVRMHVPEALRGGTIWIDIFEDGRVVVTAEPE
jgi:hypothetical protein